jgi:hypothetical protein
MLIVVAVSLGIVLALLAAGFPIAYLLALKMEQDTYKRFPFLISLAILFGFAISAFASVLSYGSLGIDTYPYVFMTLLILSWVIFFILKKKWKFELGIFGSKFDSLLLLPIAWSLFLSRSNWTSLTAPIIRAGDGPDTSQNLMTALSARTLGNTWWSQAHNINSFFGHDSLRQSVMDLYRYPSFRDQAGFDYLVFGTRWGLSVPYSQILRFFGDKATIWETGVVLLVALITLSIMVFGLFSLFSKSYVAATATTLICVSNSALLVQYFNGGLSQVWSIAGILGLFTALSLLLQRRRVEQPFSSWIVGIVAFASWLVLLATYVDAAIILALFIFLTLPIYYFFNRTVFKDMLRIIPLSGLAVLAATPVLTYATLLTFDLRLRAATGTGIPSAIWAFPSEIFGFVDVFSQETVTRSFETTAVGIFLSLAILWQLVKKLPEKSMTSDIAVMGITGFLTIAIGFVLSYTGKQHTNYIYTKIAVYVTPIIVIAWIASFKTPKALSAAKANSAQINSKKYATYGYATAVSVAALIATFSSYSATKNISFQGTAIPYTFAKLIDDKDAQAELAKYNYLTNYILSSNYLGVIGDIHWVSKAPNDLELKDRLDLPMRLLCFSADTICKPTTQRIPDAKLESFGLLQYESPISSREFAALNPRARYDANFKVFGVTPIEIPERFIGGNPYYR